MITEGYQPTSCLPISKPPTGGSSASKPMPVSSPRSRLDVILLEVKGGLEETRKAVASGALAIQGAQVALQGTLDDARRELDPMMAEARKIEGSVKMLGLELKRMNDIASRPVPFKVYAGLVWIGLCFGSITGFAVARLVHGM